jgi:ribosomal protein S12 methylthiotransferase accessory factor
MKPTALPTPSAALLHALGVSRVARVTQLDRLGIDVASAVRPRGHVLQVTQGKGRTPEAAAWSALGEAAELLAAESVPADRLVWGRATDFEVSLDEGTGLAGAWAEARWLGDDGPVWLRADAVWCPPAGGPWLGPHVSDWSTNGLAAHLDEARALEHAVLELCERDAVARALPQGWTVEAAARARVEAGLRVPADFEVYAFDLSRPGGALATAGVLLFERGGGAVPLTAGYACRRRFDDAVEAAFLEAAQSRLTEIHGAREDVSVGVRESGEALRAQLAAGRAGRARRRRPAHGSLAGLARAKVAWLTLASAPMTVVKAVSPALQCTALL